MKGRKVIKYMKTGKQRRRYGLNKPIAVGKGGGTASRLRNGQSGAKSQKK
jgi:hypothetical protein